MPSKGMRVWVTTEHSIGYRDVCEGKYVSGDKAGFYYRGGYEFSGKVVAWKPKVYPEPYWAGKENKENWVPCTNGLPDRGMKVWITVEGSDNYRKTVEGICAMNGNLFYFGGKKAVGKVIAWKPKIYPKPYGIPKGIDEMVNDAAQRCGGKSKGLIGKEHDR